jgi:hypothetical protein
MLTFDRGSLVGYCRSRKSLPNAGDIGRNCKATRFDLGSRRWRDCGNSPSSRPYPRYAQRQRLRGSRHPYLQSLGNIKPRKNLPNSTSLSRRHRSANSPEVRPPATRKSGFSRTGPRFLSGRVSVGSRIGLMTEPPNARLKRRFAGSGRHSCSNLRLSLP